jgi:hypothetical protein
MRNVLIIGLIITLLLSLLSLADTSKQYQDEVKHLKAYITESDCIFTRNGIDYKGSEAITHINRKEEYFKDKINSTEDFINLAASKSEMSGELYMVTCHNHIERLGAWLTDTLVIYRNNKR